MKITLPLPSSKLSPNARTHWRSKSGLTKAARERARLAVLSLCPGFIAAGYSMAFFWPDRRRRDDDNAEASCKAYRDGIADALGMDDHKLPKALLSTFEVDRQNPRLEITLHP